MPFALDALATIAGALAVFLFAMIAASLVGWLKSTLPNPSILGYHPLGFLDGWLNDLEAWLVGQADSQLGALHDLIGDLVHIEHWITAATLRALTLSFTYIDHLNNAVIPNSISAGLAGLLNDINQNFENKNDSNAAVAGAVAAAASAAAGIRELIGTVTHGSVEGDISAEAAAAKTNADSYTDQAVGNLSNSVANSLTNVWNAITPLQTAVATTLPADIEKEAATAAATEASDAQTAASALAATANQLTGQLATAQTQLSAAITAAEGTAVTSAESVAASNLAAAVTALQDQLDSVNKELAQLAATTTITLPQPADVTAPATITIPLAVTGLAAAVAAITTEVDECMVSTCGGPNNYLNLLNGLVTGATLAELLLWISDVAKDPSGEATAFASIASGLYTEGHALIDGLLSL